MLGFKVKDKVTGIEGIAVAHTRNLNSTDSYTIQLKGTKNNLGESVAVDDISLEKISKKPIVRLGKVAISTENLLPLGSQIQDITTKQKGILRKASTYINGCIWYSCSIGFIDGEEKFMEINALEAKMVGKGISKPEKKGYKPSGGPTKRTQRSRKH